MQTTADMRPPDNGIATGARNLVICCDGTSNEFGRKNTNVVRLFQCLERDSDRQLIYYDPGVGTLPDPHRATNLGKSWSKIIGLAFGYGLTRDVIEAYAYLMETWEPSDRVYIFGFSRGAYTARVLAGLLHTFGLMPRGMQNILPYVIKGYRTLSDRNSNEMAAMEEVYRDFRRTFSRPAADLNEERHFRVHFLGLWDTVSTVGWVWDPKSFRHTAFNPSVKFARHAMALDERRGFFRQNRLSQVGSQRKEDRSQAPEGPSQKIECWFPGGHCDVGGGYETKEDQLWPLSLEWMLKEAEEANLRIDSLRRQQVLASATSPKIWTLRHHESLEGAWKLAERFPARRWRKDYATGEWQSRFERGHGTPRKVRDGELIHRSVLLRLRETQVALPHGELGLYEPRSLCAQYKSQIRLWSSDIPEYHVYCPARCGCEACERLEIR